MHCGWLSPHSTANATASESTVSTACYVFGMAALLLAALLTWTPPCQGDGHNRHRNAAAKREFKHTHPCPGGVDQGSRRKCRGWIIDHICPLACCGLDQSQNMQWQTRAASRSKDRWETTQRGCGRLCQPALPEG